MKIDSAEEQPACNYALSETQMDKQVSAVNSSESEANQDDESDFINNTNQSAVLMVRL